MSERNGELHGLAICSGIGGLELGVELAVPGYRAVCHVEREAFAAANLAAQMEHGALAEAPVWDDVRTFDGAAWRGKVDIITAGFPCQPWSTAGKRQGTDDERWIWPAIARAIRDVGPGLVFLENVPGLVAGGGLEPVLADLSLLGFDAEWDVFSASEVGAPHRRERVFILASSRDRLEHSAGDQQQKREGDALRGRGRAIKSSGVGAAGEDVDDAGPFLGKLHEGSGSEGRGEADADGAGEGMADAEGGQLRHAPAGDRRADTGRGSPDVADSTGGGRRERGEPSGRGGQPDGGDKELADAERKQPDGRGRAWGRRDEPSDCGIFPPGPDGEWGGWLAAYPGTEPSVRRDADGLPSRTDQLRALGNGVVALCAAFAFSVLAQRLGLTAR